MYLLYELILLVAGIFLLPYAFFKGLPYGNSLEGVRQRLGLYSQSNLCLLRGKQIFWIHAVSVGEIRASLPLIKSLKNRHPESRIVLSGMTFTGHVIARKIKDVDLAIFFPFDLSSVVRRALKAIAPDLIIIIETELWPNFIRLADENGIPLALANGRISRKTFPRYRSLKKYIQPLLEKFSIIAMQDAVCARRIKAIGAPAGLIQVTGNMKFDLPLSTAEQCDLLQNKRLHEMLRDKFVWVAGSIRSGEEGILLQCHHQLIELGIPSFMILAPRHPHLFNPVGDLLKKASVPFVWRSTLTDIVSSEGEKSVLVIDTVGELTRFYALGQAIFVGGSLVPVGGHNLLEPAQLGKPVLFGPHVFNYKEISRLLLDSGAGWKVKDGDDLVESLAQLFDDEELCSRMGQAGQALIRKHAGATERTLSGICKIAES